MNKKLIALATSLIIGGTLLGTTAFASSNDSSGYDAYKNALISMHNVKSMTDTIKVSATDNGASLVAADVTVKVNKDAQTMSGDADIKVGSVENKKDVYKQGDKIITKDSDSAVYNIIEHSNGQAKWQERKSDEQQIQKRVQNFENIIDSLIGNRKSYFALTYNNDGTKNVNIKLTENQVSPVANAIVSAFIRDREDTIQKGDNIKNNIKVDFPELEKDIRISNVDVTAVINKDNMIESQKGVLTLVGDDAAGVEHTLVLNVDMGISKINSTTPDTVNLDGKQVKTVTKETFKHNK